jgi:murein DD-endopeptidase MepM/ murein hydrolase activator NlpD
MNVTKQDAPNSMTAAMCTAGRHLRRRPLAHLLAGVLVVPLLLVAPSAASAQEDDDDAARQAAMEIAAARDRANQAADALFQAQSDLDVLADQQLRLQDEIVQLQLDVEELRAAVESVAVSRFVTSGADGIPVLTDFRTPNDRMQADVLVDIIADSGASTVDEYDAARQALEDKQQELEDNETELEATQDRLEDARIEAEAEVERLREIESQRLKDEAVRKALEAQLREEQRKLDEVNRRQAAAASQAEVQARADALLDGGSDGETSGIGGGPSGGEAGGRTGGGGGGSNPRAFGDGYIDAIICPVQGASAYGDTWGAPRSGGRWHQGVDMLAPMGTPLQAVVSGFVSQRRNTLGGITLTLLGDNGNRYYYAHLSAYEGAGGPVTQGQVIGYLGDSGNATGVPHLHFEIHPSGGVAVNPTASVRLAGC